MPTPLNKPHPSPKYDWDAWLIPGKNWRFTQKKDFPNVSALVFQQQLLANAAKRGLHAITEKPDKTTVNAWIEEE